MTNEAFAAKSKTDTLKGLAAFLFIVLFVFLGMYQLQPPKAAPASAPLTEFSAERAMKHIGTIAQEPRPPASPAVARVREYILAEFAALGLDTEVQEAMPAISVSAQDETMIWVFTADVKNIVARLKGTDNTKPLLITGHYDSLETSPNASDGGASIAIMLEVARALQAGPPLKNDVIFLLTDIEEEFLMGAKAFTDWHPWAQDVGVVLSFIARGTSGPSIMFETSPENGWVIEQFAQAAPHPIANSMAYEVYQLLPNDTDFTRYRRAGLSGLNFAYIDNPAYYHTLLDNPGNLNKGSLQHQGSQALALVRHFGSLNLEQVKKDNAVYFDVWGLTLIHYPESWVIPLLTVVALVYFGVIVWGLKRKRLTFSGLGLGILALLLTVVGALVLVFLLQWVSLVLHSEYSQMYLGNLYNARLYLVSFVSFTIAIASGLYVLFRKKMWLQNLIAGGLSVWLILALLSSFYLPGASYLFVWSLFFNLLALGFTFISTNQEPTSWLHLAVFSLCAIPGLVLLVPTTYLVFITLPPLGFGGLAVAVMVVLLLGSLVPHLALMARPKAGLLPAVAVVVGVTFVVAGSLTAGFSAERPKPTNIFYGLHIDTGPFFWKDTGEAGEAFWISTNSPDEWTAQFFPNGANQDYSPFDVFDPTDTDMFLGPAPVMPLPTPDAVLLDDSLSDGVRKLRLAFSAPQIASSLGVRIFVEPNTVLRARLKGVEDNIVLRPEDTCISIFRRPYVPASTESVEVTMETTSARPIKVLVLAVYPGLPQIPNLSVSPRPAYLIPSPAFPVDYETTYVQKAFEFPAP